MAKEHESYLLGHFRDIDSEGEGNEVLKVPSENEVGFNSTDIFHLIDLLKKEHGEIGLNRRVNMKFRRFIPKKFTNYRII